MIVFLFLLLMCLLITKDIPADTVIDEPSPFLSKALTEISFDFFATPNLFPPIYQEGEKKFFFN